MGTGLDGELDEREIVINRQGGEGALSAMEPGWGKLGGRSGKRR